MFRRIGLCILAASIAFGAIIVDDQPAVAEGNDEPIETPIQENYVPKISQAELENAPLAPVYINCKTPGQVVITFDDGPNPKAGTTDAALDYLREKNIKATFFINGNNWGNLEEQESIDLVKRIHDEGHDIGSHTYNHVDLFDAIDNGTMELNIDKMTDKIEEIIGKKPAFFRPPNGSGGYPDYGKPDRAKKNEIIQKYLGASGYNIIMWGADTRDWEQKGDVDYSISILDQDINKEGGSPATHSFIILMHDVHPTTVSGVLPRVVEHVTELGYTIVPLTECLGLQSAYQLEITNDADSHALTSNRTGTEIVEQTKSDAIVTKVKMIYSFVAVVLSLFFLF